MEWFLFSSSCNFWNWMGSRIKVFTKIY